MSQRPIFQPSHQAWADLNWRQFAMTPDKMRSASMADAQAVFEAGIYFMFDGAGRLLYVGQSSDIGARMKAHAKAGKIPFETVKWIAAWADDCAPDCARVVGAMEAAYVHELDPPYNHTACPSMRAVYEPLRKWVIENWPR